VVHVLLEACKRTGQYMSPDLAREFESVPEFAYLDS
jgi:hypothetical protein